MNRSRESIWICVLVAVGSSSIVLALPPDPNLPNWKGPKNNCYNYATAEKTNNFKQPGGLPWPNVGANLTAPQWCDKVRNRAIADGLVAITWSSGDPIPTPPTGFNLVALGGLAGVKGGGGDYHWWRLNGDGTWSHKRGQTPAKTTYTNDNGTPTNPADDTEQPLTDPRNAAQRDGYVLCGFMGVAKAPPPTPKPNPGAPKSGETRAGPIITSGVPSPGRYLSGADISSLAATLPTMNLANEVSDPQWTGVMAGESAGFGIWSADDVTQLPVYMRVFRGVVAVYDDLDATTITYFNDDNGLDVFLTNMAIPTGACCGPDNCAEVTEAECRGFGHVYRGDGTTCADVDICNIPAVSHWGLVAMTLLVLTAATVVLLRRRAGLGDGNLSA